MAFCSECGEELKSGAKFCASCGHEVSSTKSVKKESSKKAEGVSEKKKPSSKKGLIIGAIVLFLFFVFFFYSEYAFDKDMDVMDEYGDWNQDYYNQVEKLNSLVEEYNGVVQNSGLSEDEQLNRIGQVVSNFASEYERYLVKSRDYRSYLIANKERIEDADIFGRDIDAELRAISENDVFFKETAEFMTQTLQQAIEVRQARSEMISNALTMLLGLL